MYNEKEYMREYRLKNKEKNKIYQKIWYRNNCEKVKERSKKWYKNNIIKAREMNKQWKENNPERFKELERNWCKKKLRIDLKYKLNRKIKIGIYDSTKINKNNKKRQRKNYWNNLVGYTTKDLIKYLKETIPDNYTWQDYLEGKLHIDHIIPISAFNFNKPEHIDFKRCWALENLRLLPAKENIIKGNKLDRSFQPALEIFEKVG